METRNVSKFSFILGVLAIAAAASTLVCTQSCAAFKAVTGGTSISGEVQAAIAASPDCDNLAPANVIVEDYTFIKALLAAYTGANFATVENVLNAWTAAKGTVAGKCEFEIVDYMATGSSGVARADAGTPDAGVASVGTLPPEVPSALTSALLLNKNPEAAQALAGLAAYVAKHPELTPRRR